jgi:hypothetical protein
MDECTNATRVLLYRERQLTFDPAGFCEWGAKPDIPEFRS